MHVRRVFYIFYSSIFWFRYCSLFFSKCFLFVVLHCNMLSSLKKTIFEVWFLGCRLLISQHMFFTYHSNVEHAPDLMTLHILHHILLCILIQVQLCIIMTHSSLHVAVLSYLILGLLPEENKQMNTLWILTMHCFNWDFKFAFS